MLSCFVLLAATSINTTTIHLSAEPRPAWIERTASAQLLNFDIIVDNPTDAPLDVDEIQLSVYDRANKLVLRKFVDGNGTRPSVRTIDLAGVAPAAKSRIFHPFGHFEPDPQLPDLGDHRPARRVRPLRNRCLDRGRRRHRAPAQRFMGLTTCVPRHHRRPVRPGG